MMVLDSLLTLAVLPIPERGVLHSWSRLGIPLLEAPGRAVVSDPPSPSCPRGLADSARPMQYYISGTIVFLVIEMLAQFAYYRYINKHGGGASSIAFLFVIAILNAARNSLSFFLLLIVSMGLSVVTQSLGSVMLKVRILTGLHFIFGGQSLYPLAPRECADFVSHSSVLCRDCTSRAGCESSLCCATYIQGRSKLTIS